MATRINVVLVAPSLSILGGQAVQADRLLRAWDGDPEVAASLLPVNPDAPGPLGALQRIKYVRTGVTQLWYWPSLLTRLRQVDVVHVFSAVVLRRFCWRRGPPCRLRGCWESPW